MASEMMLVVDNENGMRRLLGRVLYWQGYETLMAERSAEALSLAALAADSCRRRKRPHLFGAALTQLLMPGPLTQLNWSLPD